MHTFFFGQPNWQAKHLKKITVFYYGEGDSEEAKRLAAAERSTSAIAMTREAASFDGEIEQCTEVVIMANVPDHQRKKIEESYGGSTKFKREFGLARDQLKSGLLSQKEYDAHVAKLESSRDKSSVVVRGSPKWYGGEIKTDPKGPDEEVSVVVPATVTISGPKGNPEEVSQAARPDANLTTTARIQTELKLPKVTREAVRAGMHGIRAGADAKN